MVPQRVLNAAHFAAVMVRAHGPDPRGIKMRRHAFFQNESGDTTLSASGFLSLRISVLERATMPRYSVVVVTCASIVEPFLHQQPPGSSPVEARDSPKLIIGAEIDVLVGLGDGKAVDGDSQCWVPAHLECVVDISAAGSALQALLEVHGGSIDRPWEVGWTLAPSEGKSQVQGGAPRTRGILEGEPSRQWGTGEEPDLSYAITDGIRGGSAAMAATRVAILSLSWEGQESSASFEDNIFYQACEKYRPSEVSNVPFGLAVAPSLKRGDYLLAVGSPFGALSPMHFHNSLSAGVVSNCWPPKVKPAALLMADVRCLPGMEGGPVFDEHGALVGMLTRPLRQRGGFAEVQLVMTTAVLAPALQHGGVILGVPLMTQSLLVGHDVAKPTQFSGASSSLESNSRALPEIAHALKSVVLVTVGDGAWASGVIINKTGLILTNAHLLEPWRFGKMRSSQHHALLSRRAAKSSVTVEGEMKFGLCRSRFDGYEGEGPVSFNGDQKLMSAKHGQDFPSSNLPPIVFDVEGSIARSVTTVKSAEIRYKSFQQIRVRLDHLQVRSWHHAEAIYVSQGPLDIALLQLKSSSPDLVPIVPDKSSPPPGSTAIVIGHGLFGPRAELCPSVSAGVVAKVVKAGTQVPETGHGTMDGDSYSMRPVMLQTTAAVHPGGSGGAVVNSFGQMIGLVTSNARHSSGSVIPFLNFSVPYGALAPIFDFAKGSANLTSLAELDKPNKFLSAVWALVPSTPPRPPIHPPPKLLPEHSPGLPALPCDQDTKSLLKGSRFEKFISERGAELSLRNQVQSQHWQPLPKHVFESQAVCADSQSPKIRSHL